jgi:hypothetical protein
VVWAIGAQSKLGWAGASVSLMFLMSKPINLQV